MPRNQEAEEDAIKRLVRLTVDEAKELELSQRRSKRKPRLEGFVEGSKRANRRQKRSLLKERERGGETRLGAI